MAQPNFACASTKALSLLTSHLPQLASRGRRALLHFPGATSPRHSALAPLPCACPPASQLGAESEEEEDADRDEEGSESGASDDEADEEGGKGASDGGEGGREGGEGGSGREGGEGKKKGPKNDYDYMDDWIDDEGEYLGWGRGREGGKGALGLQ